MGINQIDFRQIRNNIANTQTPQMINEHQIKTILYLGINSNLPLAKEKHNVDIFV